MTLALAALSHAPTFGLVDPGDGVREELDAALDDLGSFARDFAPELTIIFGPDHFNGVFYDMMPSFCVGAQAAGVGDWGTEVRPLPVDPGYARRLAAAVMDAGVDVARSERLDVDHGVVQPLEFLYGRGFTEPVVPVVVNCVGLPLGPVRRARLLGDAVGRFALADGRRTLIVASGGLSHDPPVPVFDDATPERAAGLIDGRGVTPEQRAERERHILTTASRNLAGERLMRDINPEFDALVMRTLADGELERTDGWTGDGLASEGGSGAQEIRCWIAAFSALRVAGAYRTGMRRYWPIEPWNTGFAAMTAMTTGTVT